MKVNTQADIKENNKNNLLKMIINNPEISRSELAKKSGLSGGTITALVKELVAEDFVEESKIHPPTGGRPKVGLRVRKEETNTMVVEVKQRNLVIKCFDVYDNLLCDSVYPTTYLNGNYIVETILAHLKNIDNPIKKIGLLLEENIAEKEISYLFSTGVSNDQIPIEDAIKMFIDVEVVIDYSLKYYLDFMVTDSILENVELYANMDINKSLTTAIFNRSSQVELKEASPLTIDLPEIFDYLGYGQFWKKLSEERQIVEKGIANNNSNKKVSDYFKKLIQMLTEAIMTLQIFYPLDALFLVDKENRNEGLDEILWKSVKKHPNNKLKLIKTVVPDKNNVARKMNRRMLLEI